VLDSANIPMNTFTAAVRVNGANFYNNKYFSSKVSITFSAPNSVP
jgi:hypothetical protein